MRIEHRWGVAAGVALAAALALLLAPAIGTGGDAAPTPAPPAPASAGQDAVDVLASLLRPGGEDELRRRLAAYGIELRIRERPVSPAAAGRVFGVQFPRRARFDGEHRMILEPGVGGAVRATVGRATRGVDAAAGLTLLEVDARIGRAAASGADPAVAARALRRLGYSVRLRHVSGGHARDVAAPPQDAVVLSVLNAHGGNEPLPGSRELVLELADRGSRLHDGH